MFTRSASSATLLVKATTQNQTVSFTEFSVLLFFFFFCCPFSFVTFSLKAMCINLPSCLCVFIDILLHPRDVRQSGLQKKTLPNTIKGKYANTHQLWQWSCKFINHKRYPAASLHNKTLFQVQPGHFVHLVLGITASVFPVSTHHSNSQAVYPVIATCSQLMTHRKEVPDCVIICRDYSDTCTNPFKIKWTESSTASHMSAKLSDLLSTWKA